MLNSQQDSVSGAEAVQKSTAGAAHVHIIADDSAAAVDRELVVSTYFCKTAFTGASVGDTITSTQIIDVSGTPSTVSVVWRNQTTAADLGSAPSAANLTLLGSTALTDAQLRAANVPIIGNAYSAQATITRPNDTTPYTAGDVVGGVVTLTNMGPANGHIIVTNYDLRIDVSAVPSGMTSFRFHLYNATPPSALADNSPWDLPAGDRASYLGYIDLGTPVDVGSTLFVQDAGSAAITKKLLMGAATSLFGYLVTNGGYTPTALAVKAARFNAIGA